MTLIEEDPINDTLNRLINSGVLKDDIGGFASKLKWPLLLLED